VTVIPASIEGADRGFLERLIARVGSDDRVTALFLGGSHASGNADAYSDLDLYLITTDAGYDGVLAERKEILRSVGDIVFLEEHSDFRVPLAPVHHCGRGSRRNRSRAGAGAQRRPQWSLQGAGG
jgi:predicted nucleotidyltransferase